jgi:uncharacterized protein (TIGR03435 family)
MHKPSLIAVACSVLALGQSFEVASIRRSAFQSGDGEGSRREAIETSPDSLIMRNVTLRSCLSWAYGVQDFQVIGLDLRERYDITAKAASPVTTSELRAMLGLLLAERFKLAFHRESKSLSAYALTVTKRGAKLRESKEEGPGILEPGAARLTAQHASMAEFAGRLAVGLRMPVVDKTGMPGRYDFILDLMPYFPEAKGPDVDFAGMIIAALPDQLGLTLESRKEPIEILVVDHVEKTPSEN